MPPRRSANLDMLAIVAKGLKGLKERVVFVGGATIELYVLPAAAEGRATDDVDCVVELASRVKYHDLEQELRSLGFKHPILPGAPICRWEYSGISVDVMPTEGKVLGFNNRWYAEGIANTRKAELPDGQQIEIFSVPYLLASKIEAFGDRGRGDFLGSRDIEDSAHRPSLIWTSPAQCFPWQSAQQPISFPWGSIPMIAGEMPSPRPSIAQVKLGPAPEWP